MYIDFIFGLKCQFDVINSCAICVWNLCIIFYLHCVHLNKGPAHMKENFVFFDIAIMQFCLKITN